MAQLPTKSLLVLTALAVMAPLTVRAQTPVVTGAPAGQWPKTLEPAAKPAPPVQAQTPGQAQPTPPVEEQAAAPQSQWTPDEILAAKAKCTAALAQYQAEATQLDPIDEGECGAPAPVLLTSIGSAPKVTLSQPATVTCDMVETLGEWLKADVQPAARKLLGAKIVRLEILSSYSCRNAYGRKKTRMSEHGRANALDIKGFHTDHNHGVDVLADWGPTERDIQAQIAAAEAAAKAHALAAQAKAEAEARARAAAARQPAGPQVGSSEELGIKGIVGGTIGRAVRGPGGDAPTGLTLEQPSRLGGPKGKSEPAHAAAPPTLPQPAEPTVDRSLNARQTFLRHLQATGCRRFKTALGPEANNAHRNHFHFDMAERSSGAYCR